MGEFEDMPTWAEAADVLFDAGLTTNPSELHGALMGLLGSGAPVSDGDMVPALERALGIECRGELVDLVQRLHRATVSAVRDSNYAFYPLLPEDDDDLEARLLSLGLWTTGFLTGFTQGVTIAGAGSEGVAPDTAEALKDFAVIAQVDSAEPETDDAERDFEELAEYVRFAALNTVENALQIQDGN
ncbi:conserved hypothetical protein, putative [Luminiphilus syltensis NOR5-1B]|uniref:YecA family protein n=1 Tax=Luminiphilus syltensis NOR5-1B TaxID=565045 RepID=B8KU50_9GAMM|nr:conserved hypothetical protein, putative [Luminiphilus syltensis NOR5-1B]